jgi:hypothetical protein
MADQSDDVPTVPKQDGMTVPDNSKTIMIPVGQIAGSRLALPAAYSRIAPWPALK